MDIFRGYQGFIKELKSVNEIALHEVSNILQEEVVKITPRDPKRPPKDPSKSVTGTLKRSIKQEVRGDTAYVGVSDVGSQVVYARTQEYGNSKVRPRPYISLIKNDREKRKRFFNTYSYVMKKLGQK